MNDNILEPNFNGLPPVTDWEKVFIALQQANEKVFRGAPLKDLGQQIIGDVAIQGSDFEDLPIATSVAPVLLPIPEAEMKFGFLANGNYIQPNGPNLEYTAKQWGLTLFDGTKWVKKFTLDLPETNIIDKLTSLSKSSGLSANQGRVLDKKIEGGDYQFISGYDEGYTNTSGILTPSSSYRTSKPIVVDTGKYRALVSGTSSVMVLAACDANDDIIPNSEINLLGNKPTGNLPYEIKFEISDISGVKSVRTVSHTSIPESEIYLLKLDGEGLRPKIENVELKTNELDKTIIGNEVILAVSDYDSGYTNASGILTPSSSYRTSKPVEVSPGNYKALISGTSSVLVLSGWDASGNFIQDASVNIKGNKSVGSTPYDVSFNIPEGSIIKSVKTVSHTSIPTSDLYLKRIDPKSLNSRVFNLELQKPISKNYFNIRDKAMFCWIWDDLNVTDELVFNIFQEFGFVPNFALPSNKLNTDKLNFYTRVYWAGGSILSHDTGSVLNADSIKNSKISLEKNGFKISGYVTPNSVLDPDLLPVVKKIYGFSYTQAPPSKGVYPASGFDKTIDVGELTRIGVETWNMDEPNQQAIKNLVDWAITNKKKVTLYGHKLPSEYKNSDGTTSRLTEADLRAILDYVRSKVNNGDCMMLSAEEMMFQTY